jgi:hypothetical protein
MEPEHESHGPDATDFEKRLQTFEQSEHVRSAVQPFGRVFRFKLPVRFRRTAISLSISFQQFLFRSRSSASPKL